MKLQEYRCVAESQGRDRLEVLSFAACSVVFFLLRLVVLYRCHRRAGELSLLPGSLNPQYSLFPASHSHDRLIGPKSPGNDGGLVGRRFLPV
jgi:hypothetical protein